MGNLNIDNIFMDVYRGLSPREQRKAMKSAMRREGNRVKTAAVANLGSATGGRRGCRLGGGTRQRLSRGLYVRTYPDRFGAGFIVSVKPHGGSRGIHTNRKGKQKPVLMWAEDGTRQRNVGRRKTSFFSRSRWTGAKTRNYRRSGHSTGRMDAYRFLAKTERETADGVEERLFEDFRRNVERAAARGR